MSFQNVPLRARQGGLGHVRIYVASRKDSTGRTRDVLNIHLTSEISEKIGLKDRGKYFLAIGTGEDVGYMKITTDKSGDRIAYTPKNISPGALRLQTLHIPYQLPARFKANCEYIVSGVSLLIKIPDQAT